MIRRFFGILVLAPLSGWCAPAAGTATPPAAYATQSGLPEKWTSPSGIEFVLIPPGTFRMGLEPEPDAPPHPVKITRPFYLATREMTKGQWQRLTGKVHSTHFPGENQPVNWVTMTQITPMLKELQQDIPGARLPTEAEWEYAARAGDAAESPDGLGAMAWTAADSDNAVRETGLKAPNAFGLRDMLGNVWEWCADFYDPDFYSRSPEEEPTGPQNSLYRYFVIRGGSAMFGPEACRYGSRAFSQAGRPRPDLGLRLAFSATEAFRERYGKAR